MDSSSAYGLCLDSDNYVYVTGYTYGGKFPTTPNAAQVTSRGDDDGFLTKLTPDLSQLIYSTYLSGSDSDWGQVISLLPGSQGICDCKAFGVIYMGV